MKRIDFHRLLIALSIIFSLDSIAAQYPLTLTVLVDGAKANTGQAIASLFSSVDNYLEEPVIKQIMPINEAGKVQFIFNHLEPGRYAVRNRKTPW